MKNQRTQYDVYNQFCPSRRVLEIISDKWVILIINKLAGKTLRFGELRREVGGISQKVLTQTLRTLERHRLIARKSYPVLPLKVEYSLTPTGKSLAGIISLITEWSEQYGTEMGLI